MKAGISNIWLLGMIAIFIFIFSAYVIISVNYTKSFKMKNEVLSIIERGKGFTGLNGGSTAMGTDMSSKIVPGKHVKGQVATFQTINIYLLGNAYQATGYCPTEEDETDCWYGVTSLDNFEYEYPAKANTRYYYCFAKFRKGNDAQTNKYTRYFYKVRLFYKMEFAAIMSFLSVKVDGKTADIVDVQDINSSGTSTLKVCKD